MALIKCADCGRQVSDMALTCPQCSRSIEALKLDGCSCSNCDLSEDNYGRCEKTYGPKGYPCLSYRPYKRYDY
jgi:hypothetical protein